MTIDKNNIIDSIFESISRIDHIKIDNIPNIPLYMDQVTTLMENQLQSTKRYSDDKILTKTMINNYAKNNLLPPPVKKKYNKEHVLVLIFIYYFKNILSIKDIETLLDPITSNYFSNDISFNIASIYDEVFHMEKSCIESLKADIKKSYESAQDTFTDSEDPNKEFLQLFSFICALSFDVYVKKQIIEELVDSLTDSSKKKQKRTNDSKNK